MAEDLSVSLSAFPPMSQREAELLSPLQLALIGDSVYDLLARTHFVGKRLNTLHAHKSAVSLVNARAQSAAYSRLEALLTESEMRVMKRGRNTPTHRAPKNQSPSDYARATGVEALLGYLFLTGQSERIRELAPRLLASKEDENAES